MRRAPGAQAPGFVWPHVVGLLVVTVACFVATYVVFLRQEVRA